MSTFTQPLIVEPLADGTHWRLVTFFEYHVGRYPSEEIIRVPSGYVTDFATIPKVLWSIIGGPTGKYTAAAVIHDYLCSCKGRLPWARVGEITTYRVYTKEQADAIFREAMGVLGVGSFQARLMWASVRVFGNRSGWYKG